MIAKINNIAEGRRLIRPERLIIMTGENFIRISRHDTHLEKMLNDLWDMQAEWARAYHDTENEKYYDILYEIENRIGNLKNNIYTYVYNRNLGNYDYVRDFERRYL
jgi:hypothetical protein